MVSEPTHAISFTTDLLIHNVYFKSTVNGPVAGMNKRGKDYKLGYCMTVPHC